MTDTQTPLSAEELAWIDLRIGVRASDWDARDRRRLRAYITHLTERLTESQRDIESLRLQIWRMGATT